MQPIRRRIGKSSMLSVLCTPAANNQFVYPVDKTVPLLLTPAPPAFSLGDHAAAAKKKGYLQFVVETDAEPTTFYTERKIRHVLRLQHYLGRMAGRPISAVRQPNIGRRCQI